MERHLAGGIPQNFFKNVSEIVDCLETDLSGYCFDFIFRMTQKILKIEAGTSSTIDRLNLIFVILLAWLLFNEQFSLTKILGFLFAMLTVFL